MRVLHLVSSPTLTGAAEPALDMVLGLRALGVQADLRIDRVREGNLAGVLAQAQVEAPADLALSTKAGPAQIVGDLLRLPQLLAGYDVVHTHMSHDHALAAVARASAPSVRLVRSVHAARVLAPGLARGWVLRDADGLTVACRDHRDRLRRDHGVPATRILRLPGSVSPARFFPDPAARARVRTAEGWAGRFCVGCVARFQAGRRHEVLMDAAALARRQVPELTLVLIGHGETEAALRQRAAAPDLAGAVVFTGYKRADLNDYLSALDAAAWLVPGNDATSRSVLQAMAAGLPVIGGDEGAIREAVRPGRTGLLAAPDDPGAVAAAMVALALDPGRAEGMGLRGLARARRLYHPSLRARRLLAFYRRILS
ncbi:MAG: glycosyltransferase family 4 protein [Deltaproteobacteria bacterium]|nr:glycosyltransferase family 4 protein [Deltaproteobacteria bacterium]